MQEAQVALNIAYLVEKYLCDVGYDVKVFQADDLAEIVDVSNYWNSDLFVSIHCNAYNGIACGTTTIFYEYSDEGAKLAQYIQDQIVTRGCL